MLDKTYDPKEIEARRYPEWESSGAFKAHPESAKPPYCIVIPPPNVTGSLHMGHALDNTLQDVLIRWRRMKGDDVLWQPGTDHAGIATQMVVVRNLEQEGIGLAVEGAEKGDGNKKLLNREQFLEKAFHSQTFSRNCSRFSNFLLPSPFSAPSTARPMPSCSRLRTTTIWVAMPAWSVPGCHSTSSPFMRRQRISTSCSVLSSAWPMCRLPVTLGGGITMQYGGLADSGCALNAPELSHSGYRRASI